MEIDWQGSYGGDKTHALSAWTSTDRSLDSAKLLRIPELLKFLATEGHHTPFEKSMIHVLVRCDTATHIQILKHRIGVSVNGESARYRQISPTFHIPQDWPIEWQLDLQDFCRQGEAMYGKAIQELEPILGRKRAKESARFFLPYASELTLDVSFNFRSLMHFCNLRYDEHAQEEIQNVAQGILQMVKDTNEFNASLAAFGFNL